MMNMRLKSRLSYAGRECRRLAVPLLISIGAFLLAGKLSDVSKTALLVYKLSIVSMAVILAHMIRSELFPYIDLRTVLENGDTGAKIGVCVLIGLVMLGIILGVTLGL